MMCVREREREREREQEDFGTVNKNRSKADLLRKSLPANKSSSSASSCPLSFTTVSAAVDRGGGGEGGGEVNIPERSIKLDFVLSEDDVLGSLCCPAA